jgi:hypothetical protein
MKAIYLISNDDYNYSYLHTNGQFYNCIVNVGSCKLVTYKNLKLAQKKANSLNCAFVVEVKAGQMLSEGVIVR